MHSIIVIQSDVVLIARMFTKRNITECSGPVGLNVSQRGKCPEGGENLPNLDSYETVPILYMVWSFYYLLNGTLFY